MYVQRALRFAQVKGMAPDVKPGSSTLILPPDVWAAEPLTTDSRGEQLSHTVTKPSVSTCIYIAQRKIQDQNTVTNRKDKQIYKIQLTIKRIITSQNHNRKTILQKRDLSYTGKSI